MAEAASSCHESKGLSYCRQIYLGTLPASCVTLLRSPRPNSLGASHSHVMPPVRQPKSNKSCGSPQGSGTRDEARAHVNPEKFPDWVGYSTSTSADVRHPSVRNFIFWGYICAMADVKKGVYELKYSPSSVHRLRLLSSILTKFEPRVHLLQNSTCHV